jgi:hypothetical protein
MTIAPRILFLSLVLLVAGAPRVQAAPAPGLQTVAVLPVTGDNISPDILVAAYDILKDHLQRAGVYAVVEPARPSPSIPPGAQAPLPGVEPTPAEAAQLGAAAGADLAVVLRIVHFGNSARLRLTAYATRTAQVVYWDSLVVNGGPDDLDVAIHRLVDGMKSGKPVRDSAELETVTDKETMALNRRQANRSFGLRITSLLPFNTAGGDFEAVTAGGLFWLYDARAWMADVAVDIGGGGGGRFFIDAALGAYYPLLREDFTPYVGGQVRWAEMELGGGGAGGITLQPTVGLLLGRLSSAQIRVEAGYFFNTYGETRSSYYDASGNYVAAGGEKHYGNGFVFSAGIGF